LTKHCFAESRILQTKAQHLVPGGCHTYAKGHDQYPVLAPGFIVRGRGCHVWDADDSEYIEYGMGNRAVTLGHAFSPVIDAVRAELDRGCNFTRPSPIEVACAEKFLSLIGGAEMVKFCKDGSDATSGAIRLARAWTGRDHIALCADHPFFSVDDWFIGTTEMGAGVPTATRQLSLSFRYNDLESARKLFLTYPGTIAAVILEPSRTEDPTQNFLHDLRQLCHDHGALFILDEMITGFRWHRGGGQQLFGITPDLSCFGKALANGFSVSALAGKREFMRLGGLDHVDKPRVFLLSTTHGGETHSLAAAIATMEIYATEPVVEHFYAMGARLRTGVTQAIARRGLQDYIELLGRDCCLIYVARDSDRAPSQAFRSLLLQETIRRGVLMPSLAVSYSHGEEDIDVTIEAIDGSLEIYERALADGVTHHLVGRPSEPVQRRFNRSRTGVDALLPNARDPLAARS
jgi:glutamate-1-semialdehyde 2,1-aminomutase